MHVIYMIVEEWNACNMYRIWGKISFKNNFVGKSEKQYGGRPTILTRKEEK